MTKIQEAKNYADLTALVNEILPNEKTCEKNLLMTALLFIKGYCSISEHNFTAVAKLVETAKVNQIGSKNVKSDFSLVIEEALGAIPRDRLLDLHYQGFIACPIGMQGQAVSTLLWTLAPFVAEESKTPEIFRNPAVEEIVTEGLNKIKNHVAPIMDKLQDKEYMQEKVQTAQEALKEFSRYSKKELKNLYNALNEVLKSEPQQNVPADNSDTVSDDESDGVEIEITIEEDNPEA